MSNSVLKLSMATMKDLADWRYGEYFFEKLFALDPMLVPLVIGAGKNKYGSVASLKVGWGVRSDVDTSMGRVSLLMPTTWQRDSQRNFGEVDFAKFRKDGKLLRGTINVSADFNPEVDWLSFLRWCCQEFAAVAATLHVLAPEEVVTDPRITGPYSRFYQPIGGRIDEHGGGGLRNLGWATYFGPPHFSKEADFEALQSQGFHVEALAGGNLVLLSEQLTGVINDFPTFSRRRAELKGHFRPDLFEIKYEPGDPRADNRGLPGYPL